MVMYRDFIKRAARRLGLTGFVKNNPDGSVFVIGEGEEDDLRAFLKKLEKGPMLAHVDRVEVAWKKAASDFSYFHIVYSHT